MVKIAWCQNGLSTLDERMTSDSQASQASQAALGLVDVISYSKGTIAISTEAPDSTVVIPDMVPKKLKYVKNT